MNTKARTFDTRNDIPHQVRATMVTLLNQQLADTFDLYSQIKQIPTIAWVTNEEGKRVKRFVRREYITALSNLLGEELKMDPERIEDLIHAKAALYNQIPFVLKENIDEREYYRLKMCALLFFC